MYNIMHCMGAVLLEVHTQISGRHLLTKHLNTTLLCALSLSFITMYAIFQGIAAERDSRPSSPLPPLSMDSVSYILNTTERRILYDYVVEVYITMLCIAYCIQFPLYLYLYAYVYTHIRHLLISEHLCVCVCVCVCVFVGWRYSIKQSFKRSQSIQR